MKLHIVAVIGGKHSGKTTVVETLVKGLVKRGYKVATVKHVSQKNFTMDTEGKDTWRHAKAGATITTTVAANEIATIKKGDTSHYKIDDIIKPFKTEVDVIVFEGSRKLVKTKNIPKNTLHRRVKRPRQTRKHCYRKNKENAPKKVVI